VYDDIGMYEYSWTELLLCFPLFGLNRCYFGYMYCTSGLAEFALSTTIVVWTKVAPYIGKRAGGKSQIQNT